MVAAQNALRSVYILLPLIYPAVNQSPAPVSKPEWSYDNVHHWGASYQKCSGKRQSPIHIQTAKSYVPRLPPIKFSNYDVPLYGNITLSNNGHSVEFEVPPTINGARPFISGSTLPNKYEAVGLHFHWGSGGSKGSEHMIDNRRYDAEMHIVHKNVNYATVAEATKHSDGLAVLGIMFKVSKSVDRVYPGLNEIFKKIPYVEQYKSSTTLGRHITMAHMLGDLNRRNFFTYSGSLTTPDCAEAVIWHVFPDPLPIAYEQMQRFWSIKSSHGSLLINNFRPLQELNGRPVLYRVGLKRVRG